MKTIAAPGADSAARQDLLERYARLVIQVGVNLASTPAGSGGREPT